MGLQKHRSEVRKKSKIKKILEDQPLKKEREKIGLTEKEKKKAVNIGKGKKAAIKTKKAVKKFGKDTLEGVKKDLSTMWKGAKVVRKKIGDFANIEKGFTKEMLGLKKGGRVKYNKGGSVDARKIAKKYFKGTF